MEEEDMKDCADKQEGEVHVNTGGDDKMENKNKTKNENQKKNNNKKQKIHEKNKKS